MSVVQGSVNTTENIQVNRPSGSSAPEEKDWDSMTPAEQAAARAAAQRELAEANKPDPAKDREIDRVLGQMKNVFKDQKRHPIILYQINGAMRAAGHKNLPPVQLGINGYNFVIPRGVPVDLPEDAIRILYQSGEITPQTMLTLGLATSDELMADLNAANEVAALIESKLTPMEM